MGLLLDQEAIQHAQRVRPGFAQAAHRGYLPAHPRGGSPAKRRPHRWPLRRSPSGRVTAERGQRRKSTGSGASSDCRARWIAWAAAGSEPPSRSPGAGAERTGLRFPPRWIQVGTSPPQDSIARLLLWIQGKMWGNGDRKQRLGSQADGPGGSRRHLVGAGSGRPRG